MDRFAVFSMLELLLAGAAAVCFVIQLLYYRITYLRPCRKAPLQPKPEEPDAWPPVSVIVYANKESFYLKENLPALLKQDYPQYEVIVVNDGSTTESDDILKLFANDYPHLYHTFTPQESKYLSRRKLSLMIGVKAAKNDILLFTEAGCCPLTDQWIRAMVRNYTGQTSIVLGFCAYRTHAGFFHKLAAYDNLIAGVQYISAALVNRPYSGNGKNLSYRKTLFYEQKGYSHSLGLHAGDDNLFINESATGRNTCVTYTPASITGMAPFDCFAAWKEMRIARAATQAYFKGNRLLFYRMEKLSAALFLVSVAALITAGAFGAHLQAILLGALLYTLLYIVKAIVWKKTATMLQQPPFTAWLPFLEIVDLSISLYLRIYHLFHRKRDYTFTLGGGK
ncbi:MAG: glycosyltransferase [Tannerellaceae bacterium]|jgi:glycosyltransferase involved in cell wall biosynthesis|nr:glycosyltransferase [Tannerellaceae bacterium]